MTARIVLAITIPLLVAGVAWVAPKVKDRLSPTTPDVPGDDDREASDPVEHEGASEEWGAKLASLKDMAAPVDLPLKAAEQMVVDHEALAAISTALDDFDRNVSDAISRFLRNQPKVLLRLPSSVEETGELPVVELVGAA